MFIFENGEASITFSLPKKNASFWGQVILVENCLDKKRDSYSPRQAFTVSPTSAEGGMTAG